MNSQRRLWLVALILTLLVVGAFASGFVAHQSMVDRGFPLSGLRLVQGPATSDVAGSEPDIAEWQMFGLTREAWDRVKESFAKKLPAHRELAYGAIKGMLGALGDRYTRFMTPEEVRLFQSGKEGRFEGIGAVIGMRRHEETGEEVLVIIEPLPNSPASQAGLKALDRIIEIDDKSTEGMSTQQAAELIRGEPATDVVLTVIRQGVFRPIEIRVRRAKVDYPVVDYLALEEDVGYLSIHTFSENTPGKVDKALDELEAAGMRALLLDLRGNPGGLLDSAQAVASRFIAEGPVAYTVDSRGHQNPVPSDNDAYRGYDFPIVVLVNGFSASGSEIVAGALRDYGLAELVGTKTFGKGLVQTVMPLSDGSALIVTTASYLTPNRHNLNEKGLPPDVEVKSEQDEAVEPMQHPLPSEAETYVLVADALAEGSEIPELTAAEREKFGEIMHACLDHFRNPKQLSLPERLAEDRQVQAAMELVRERLAQRDTTVAATGS